MYSRLTRWVKTTIKPDEGELPDVRMHDMEGAWRVWTLCEMFDWRFLPSQILEQPEALMDDLLRISDAKRRVKEDCDG